MEPDHILIHGRRDIVVQSLNDCIKFSKMINFKWKWDLKEYNYHYITHNNGIRKLKKNIVWFDLIRMKFSVKLSKVCFKFNEVINNDEGMEDIEIDKDNYNCPSEFIDIWIPDYFDFGRKHYHNHYIHTNFKDYYFTTKNQLGVICTKLLMYD